MRISIAMATHAGSKFVREQLDSFAQQTRLPDQLVVCDDCSPDDTAQQLEAFAAQAPFEVRVEQNPEQLGTTANFEKAISLCSGDLVFLSDQDDRWRPEKVEVFEQLFEARPELGAAFSNGRVIDADGESLGHTVWEGLMFTRAERSLVERGLATDVFSRHVVAAGCTLAFRSAYRDLYLPLPSFHDCHDAWISFLIASVAEVAIVDRELIDYRWHGENQFGLRKLSLREQLEKARWQLESGIFEYGMRLFALLDERLEMSTRPVDPRAEALVAAKIDHCEKRNDMSPHFFARLPAILGEAWNGNYGRFSYGLKSVAQDLFLRR
jgi:glycosyltransferase involved in cell wall biosynthesis